MRNLYAAFAAMIVAACCFVQSAEAGSLGNDRVSMQYRSRSCGQPTCAQRVFVAPRRPCCTVAAPPPPQARCCAVQRRHFGRRHHGASRVIVRRVAPPAVVAKTTNGNAVAVVGNGNTMIVGAPPCGGCNPRPPVNPCGRPNCGVSTATGTTDDGFKLHAANSAPAGARPCTKMVNGIAMTGKCW